MIIMPNLKKCERCQKTYNWNPNAGVTTCPSCLEKDKKMLIRTVKVYESKKAV